MDKTDTLLKQTKKLYHTGDLRNLWHIDNPSTLRKTISRYIQKGVLIPVYRGFYSVVPVPEIDPLELGSAALHEYAYVSTETVLAQSGVIFQNIPSYTFCSTKTKRFEVAGTRYGSRQLNDAYLYNKTGIIDKGKYKIASPERAMADMLYFNPSYHFDAKDEVDKNIFEKIRREVYGT